MREHGLAQMIWMHADCASVKIRANPCHPCSIAASLLAKAPKPVTQLFVSYFNNKSTFIRIHLRFFILKDDSFYTIKPRTEYPVCLSYPDGYECRFSIKGRTLHVTHDNPNKVWLDVYPWIFYGSLLESYEVVIKGDKVESYRRDYPDAQAGFTGMRYHSIS